MRNNTTLIKKEKFSAIALLLVLFKCDDEMGNWSKMNNLEIIFYHIVFFFAECKSADVNLKQKPFSHFCVLQVSL